MKYECAVVFASFFMHSVIMPEMPKYTVRVECELDGRVHVTYSGTWTDITIRTRKDGKLGCALKNKKTPENYNSYIEICRRLVFARKTFLTEKSPEKLEQTLSHSPLQDLHEIADVLKIKIKRTGTKSDIIKAILEWVNRLSKDDMSSSCDVDFCTYSIAFPLQGVITRRYR